MYPKIPLSERTLGGISGALSKSNSLRNHVIKYGGSLPSGVMSQVRVSSQSRAPWMRTPYAPIHGWVIGWARLRLNGAPLCWTSQFNEPDLLDDLRDHWTSAEHAAEREQMVRRLQVRECTSYPGGQALLSTFTATHGRLTCG